MPRHDGRTPQYSKTKRRRIRLRLLDLEARRPPSRWELEQQARIDGTLRLPRLAWFRPISHPSDISPGWKEPITKEDTTAVDVLNHPITQMLDAYAGKATVPDRRTIDDLIDRTLGHDSTISREELRTELSKTFRAMAAQDDVGNAGEARRIARSASRDLVERVGAMPTAADGQSVSDVVASIPRGAI